MSRHQSDLMMCMNPAGINTGILCEKCDGRCPSCDSYVRPRSRVTVCDQCSFGKQATQCILCGSTNGKVPAYYCWECCKLGKNRKGCPRIINIGSNKMDRYFGTKKDT
ncbi:uncharacterized protein GVI51_K07931 [Nakaseomyces glabratus]|uniref:Pre-mRNA-splicing factor RDS3 n=1 Tax=Candida glabrata (strain ATCC 2001 / BCRC 20586 / JCM 3761 / NBRC 0622 / NRRL Y-65 / CBS 138) TaxID=284593 RepID=Q6FMH2_CANGA|nr:uncharacterized protein CAGL0K08074g [Nakaseomyces glabratus]KAH7582347.1 PHF5-like protein [Nakaseomyces glabratus]KAH7583255.1 PHF5-like protein [Nakaseomyces glabratus]KAH7584678.1 PHF5-like protein [Nakaseomyces glabratus]KAH7596279.1 PHF5-like protein [Nakaseomyces glabratus]KAH7597137.1 PHF5-like protein [Nakaseomyces glabratus]|eukprot:XP_448572.1 uncharacterized protein CAGL0K08074g [[Candida] glabrata]